jgi:hypothetical protein
MSIGGATMQKYGSYAEEVAKRDGFTAYIVNDEDPVNPRKEYDNVGTMVSFHDSHYGWGDEQLGRDEEDGSGDERRRRVIERAYRMYKDAAVFLWLEHSAYDSSLRVTTDAAHADGFIYCTRAQAASEWGTRGASNAEGGSAGRA